MHTYQTKRHGPQVIFCRYSPQLTNHQALTIAEPMFIQVSSRYVTHLLPHHKHWVDRMGSQWTKE